MQSVDLSGPFRGCLYYALLGLPQATGLAGGYDSGRRGEAENPQGCGKIAGSFHGFPTKSGGQTLDTLGFFAIIELLWVARLPLEQIFRVKIIADRIPAKEELRDAFQF